MGVGVDNSPTELETISKECSEAGYRLHLNSAIPDQMCLILFIIGYSTQTQIQYILKQEYNVKILMQKCDILINYINNNKHTDDRVDIELETTRRHLNRFKQIVQSLNPAINFHQPPEVVPRPMYYQYAQGPAAVQRGAQGAPNVPPRPGPAPGNHWNVLRNAVHDGRFTQAVPQPMHHQSAQGAPNVPPQPGPAPGNHWGVVRNAVHNGVRGVRHVDRYGRVHDIPYGLGGRLDENSERVATDLEPNHEEKQASTTTLRALLTQLQEL